LNEADFQLCIKIVGNNNLDKKFSILKKKPDRITKEHQKQRPGRNSNPSRLRDRQT
jgi:hypothetical protein